MAGRPRRQGSKGRRRGKSGLHGGRAPGNARRAKAQGKRRREQTAGNAFPARVKGCGKSAPPRPQGRGHGKPRPEQDRIGMHPPALFRGAGASARHSGRSRQARRKACRRGMAVTVRRKGGRVQNPAYRPSDPYGGGCGNASALAMSAAVSQSVIPVPPARPEELGKLMRQAFVWPLRSSRRAGMNDWEGLLIGLYYTRRAFFPLWKNSAGPRHPMAGAADTVPPLNQLFFVCS